MKKKQKTKLGWHVLPESGEIGVGWNGDRRKPKVGQWVKYRDGNNQPTKLPPQLCRRGMHAWLSLKRAIRNARNKTILNKMCWLCRVEIKEQIRTNFFTGKAVGAYRKILWKVLLTHKEVLELRNYSLFKDSSALNKKVQRIKRKQATSNWTTIACAP